MLEVAACTSAETVNGVSSDVLHLRRGSVLVDKTIDVHFCELESSLVHAFFLNPEVLGVCRSQLSRDGLSDVRNRERSNFFNFDNFDIVLACFVELCFDVKANLSRAENNFLSGRIFIYTRVNKDWLEFCAFCEF